MPLPRGSRTARGPHTWLQRLPQRRRPCPLRPLPQPPTARAPWPATDRRHPPVRYPQALSIASATYMGKQNDINEKMRAILIDWLVEVHLKFKLMIETLYLTVNVIDRYLEKETITRNKLQLVGVTAMFLASKYEEIYAPECRDFVYISDKAYTREQILAMEGGVLAKLNFQLTTPNAYVFLKRFSKVVGIISAPRSKTELLANFLVELTLQEYKMLKYLPSMIAASAVYLALKTMGQPCWVRAPPPHTPTLRSNSSPGGCCHDTHYSSRSSYAVYTPPSLVVLHLFCVPAVAHPAPLVCSVYSHACASDHTLMRYIPPRSLAVLHPSSLPLHTPLPWCVMYTPTPARTITPCSRPCRSVAHPAHLSMSLWYLPRLREIAHCAGGRGIPSSPFCLCTRPRLRELTPSVVSPTVTIPHPALGFCIRHGRSTAPSAVLFTFARQHCAHLLVFVSIFRARSSRTTPSAVFSTHTVCCLHPLLSFFPTPSAVFNLCCLTHTVYCRSYRRTTTSPACLFFYNRTRLFTFLQPHPLVFCSIQGPELAHHACYSESALLPCVRDLNQLHKDAPKNNLQAVRKKYAQEKHGAVSGIPPASL